MMTASIESLRCDLPAATLIFCAGFEERAAIAPMLIAGQGVPVKSIIILKYEGGENSPNLEKIRRSSSTICGPDEISEISCRDYQSFIAAIQKLDSSNDDVILDITGLARVPMMEILSALYDKGVQTSLIYTEAEEYYPRKQEFEKLTRGKDPDDAFLMLSKFEADEIMYSSQCEIEEVPSLRGKMYPNYPLMLIAFLTFKRGRVSVILQSFEANIRVLIKGIPVREDLKWRADAIEVPNADLMDGSQLHELGTLDWEETYRFLSKLYDDENNKYRMNFVLAPLGSKMQTVGAWLFARQRGDVRVISSTPKTIFHEKYSCGNRETFVFRKFLSARSVPA
jgi:hypothetical protein